MLKLHVLIGESRKQWWDYREKNSCCAGAHGGKVRGPAGRGSHANPNGSQPKRAPGIMLERYSVSVFNPQSTLGDPCHLSSGSKLSLWEVEWPPRGHMANRWLRWIFSIGISILACQCAFLWISNILHFNCHSLNAYTPAKSFHLIW